MLLLDGIWVTSQINEKGKHNLNEKWYNLWCIRSSLIKIYGHNTIFIISQISYFYDCPIEWKHNQHDRKIQNENHLRNFLEKKSREKDLIENDDNI